MAVRDISKPGVESPLDEVRRIGFDAMLENYGGRPSIRWYVEVGGRRFDQSALLRAAHVHQGLGLGLGLGVLRPRARGRFNAGDVRRPIDGTPGYRLVATDTSSAR